MTDRHMHDPDTIDEIYGQSVDKIIAVMESDVNPNLLLHGPPGTGKTTTAEILGDRFGDADKINVSKSRQIHHVRNKIEPMACTSSISGSNRIIILDEMDYMNKDAQRAMRTIMDESSAIFIATCNDVDMIIDALQSRMMSFEFGPVSEMDMRHLLRESDIGLHKQEIDRIIEKADGDVRTALDEALVVTLTR